MPTVLVVDDSLEILSALSEALSDEGWVVVGADSAEAAVYAVKDRPVDVILCDLLLAPGIDGLALRDRFAALGLGHLPFAFMTASSRDMARLDGKPVLRKPFALSAALEFLNAAMAATGAPPARRHPGA